MKQDFYTTFRFILWSWILEAKLQVGQVSDPQGSLFVIGRPVEEGEL